MPTPPTMATTKSASAAKINRTASLRASRAASSLLVEPLKLEKQQQGINKHVASDRKANGGALTAREKKQVNKEQNQASRNIYKKKHNAATQPNAKKPS